MIEVNPKLILESDSASRIDAQKIITEEWDESEAAKHVLEEV